MDSGRELQESMLSMQIVDYIDVLIAFDLHSTEIKQSVKTPYSRNLWYNTK